MNNGFVRPLRRSDLSRVAHLVEVNGMFPPEMLAAMTAPYFDDPESRQQWLVHYERGVEGVAYVVPEPLTEGTWNLLLIAVDPIAHGRGIGSRLIHHVEALLAATAERILLVETSGRPAFERTRRFYGMLGYEREAQIRDYYAQGDDKIVFRKRLA